ncbi:class I adenylate-forming enzyme family protein [Actinophytocola gossypii]|uniref:AMP-binding protein n=1 Tax=Actinophytocola gossypii TaxID=2812003 RepID=A0ABT2J6R2_9PSEU|nr:AMP-binding protein [Actinophytocola gossypii]MCT2583545.1 AMP-binding protein [Actinophytocola gossypii]
MTYRPMLQLGDHLRLSAHRFPDRPCFVRGDGSAQTFAETNSRVNRLAHALAAHGIGKADRIAILAVDSIGYYEVIHAGMKLGATYVPLNNRLAEQEVETLLRRAGPVALFVSSRYAATARAVAGRIGGVRLLVNLDEPDYEALVASGADVEPDVRVLDTDILGLAFTSGTTGLPKGVLQPQGMLKALVAMESVEYEMRPGEFRYTASPAFHIAGQAMIFLHVARGFPTLILPQFDDRTTLRWMREGGLTGCFLVPTMIRRLLDLPEARESTYPLLRTIIYGGEPMSAGLLREAMDVFGCGFINAFGAATEGGLQGVLSTVDHERAAAGETHLLGSIGLPPTGVEVRIVDEDDREVPPGVVGEVISRSDAVMAGYLEMPAETERALRGGWFRGGDLAYRDEQGYLYVAGRATDMIIRGGENVYPVEIETVLARLPGVVQAAVVGKPDERWGEVVVAVLTLADGAVLTTDEVRAHCRAHLAAYKVPELVRFVDAMPLNASGKILKRELRRDLATV